MISVHVIDVTVPRVLLQKPKSCREFNDKYQSLETGRMTLGNRNGLGVSE